LPTPPETEPIKWANVLAVKNVDAFFEDNAKKAKTLDPLTSKSTKNKTSLKTQQINVRNTSKGLVLTADKTVTPESKNFSHWRMATVYNPTIPDDWINYNYLSFWVYLEGAESASFNTLFELKDKIKVGGKITRPFIFTEKNIEAGKWTRVFLNFCHVPPKQRFQLKNYRIYIYTIGREPDSPTSQMRLYMDKFQLLKITPRKWEGWEPDSALVTVNQLGYPRFATKHAYMNHECSKDGEEFQLINCDNKKVAYKGKIKIPKGGRTPYALLDFSNYTKPGCYQILCGKLSSYPFHIGDKLHEDLLKESFSFISGSRSGDSTSLHGASHLDDGIFKGKRHDVSGGYYDACDVRRYGGNSCIVAESCLNAVEFGELPPRLSRYILEEARWACQSHHKILKATGIIPRSIEEVNKKPEFNKNNCFSDNIKGNSDDREFSNESASPGDVHLLYAKAAAQLAFLLSERKAHDAQEALQRAEWAWELFMSPGYWKKNKIGGTTGSHINALKAQTAMYLYRTSKSPKYLDMAKEEGLQLLKAQNRQPYSDAPFPITGNFTSGKGYHNAILHKERALAALADLCQFLPQSPYNTEYREALEFSMNSLIKPIDNWSQPYSVPFVFFPKPGKSLKNKRNDIGRAGNYLVRPMFNYAYAQARVAQALKSYELEDIVIREIGWVLGMNPFAVSFVWDVGTETQRQCHALHGVPKGTLFGGAVVNASGEPFYLRDDKSIGCIGIEVHIPRQARFLQTLALISGSGKVSGRIQKGNKLWKGNIKIFTNNNEFVRDWEITQNGLFGPVSLPPGQYKIIMKEKEIPFDIVTGTKQTLNIIL
jgi:hypothetical protein